MLPSNAIDDLAMTFNKVDDSLVWPRQVQCVMVVLQEKPKGGDRPICLVSLFVKLWESLHGETVLAWERDRIGFGTMR